MPAAYAAPSEAFSLDRHVPRGYVPRVIDGRAEVPPARGVRYSELLQRPRDVLLGAYDYRALLAPRWPFCRGSSQACHAGGGFHLLRPSPSSLASDEYKGQSTPPPFFELNDRLPLLLALLMGLQHFLAMVGGILIPPVMLTAPAKDPALTAYMCSVALIMSGAVSFMQVCRFPVPFTRGKIFWGTGMVCVAGCAMTFVPVALSIIDAHLADGRSFDEAYGAVLGTLMATCWVALVVALLPPRALRALLPELVCGIAVTLIGCTLIGSGLKAWGGGSACEQSRGPCAVGATAFPYGAWQYLVMGLLSFATLLLMELFGSPFMRNCQVIIALLVGTTAAALWRPLGGSAMLDLSHVAASPWLALPLQRTFPLSVHPPALLPCLVAFIMCTMESAGDITGSHEASRLPTRGVMFQSRLQGGLISDALGSLISLLFTAPPNVTYSQNNGIIACTAVASRAAGYSCAMWLMLFGAAGKLQAVFAAIPSSVLGGVMTVLFAQIFVSGIRIISMSRIDRRARTILSMSIGLGLGVIINPGWALGLWPPPSKDGDGGTSGGDGGVLRSSVLMILDQGYILGSVLAMVLNLLLPHDDDEDDIAGDDEEGSYYRVENDDEGSSSNSSSRGVEAAAGDLCMPPPSDVEMMRRAVIPSGGGGGPGKDSTIV